MHAPALYRESKSPHDDAPLEAFVGPVFELWNPPELLPDPPRDLSRFAHTMTVHPPTPSTFPRDFIEARAAIAAKHGFTWERGTAFHVIDDAHVTMLAIWNTRRAFEREGYVVELRSDATDRDVLNVWIRRDAVSCIGRDPVTAQREADGADVEDAA